MNLEELAKPFSPASIHFRVGATNVGKDGNLKWGEKPVGIALGYLDARDVMARLDFVCGPENWQVEYPFPGCCRIGIYVCNPVAHDGLERWVWKSNGAGETNVEGEKGQYSDAFKRAAVLWGIGQYLYDMPNQWYDMEKKGRSHVFTGESKKLMQKHLNDWQKVLVPKSVRMEVAKQTRDCLRNGDEHGIIEIWQEFNADEQISLWPEFDSAERASIKKLMEGV